MSVLEAVEAIPTVIILLCFLNASVGIAPSLGTLSETRYDGYKSWGIR